MDEDRVFGYIKIKNELESSLFELKSTMRIFFVNDIIIMNKSFDFLFFQIIIKETKI